MIDDFLARIVELGCCKKGEKNHLIVIQLEQIVAYHAKIIKQESIN